MSDSPGPESAGLNWTRHNLADHDDVDATPDTDGQVLAWDESATEEGEEAEGRWVGKDIADLITPEIALAALDLPTVDPEDGETVWNDSGVLKVASAGA